MPIFSIPFSCIGLFLFFSFKEIIIDKRKGQFTEAWGVVFPFRRTVKSLPKCNFVELHSEVRESRDSNGHSKSYTMYILCLTYGEMSTQIWESNDLLETRMFSEKLASLMLVPIKDTSLGTEIIRQVDELNLSLGKILRKNSTTVDKPKIPETLATRIDEGYDNTNKVSTIVKFRSLAHRCPGYLYFILTVSSIAVSILLYRVYSFRSSYSGQNFIPDLAKDSFSFIVFICLIALIVSSVKLFESLIQTKIGISSSQLVITKGIILPFKSKQVKLDQIENLIVKEAPKKVIADITAVGDKFCIQLLKDFDLEEVQFLEQLIKFKAQKKT